jgi:hypothetical protein
MKNLKFNSGENMGGFVRLWLAPAPESYGRRFDRDGENMPRFIYEGYQPHVLNGYLQNLPEVEFSSVYVQPGSLRFSEKFARAQEGDSFQVNIEALHPKAEADKMENLQSMAGQKLIALVLDANGMFRLVGTDTRQYLELEFETNEQASPEDLNAIKIVLSGNFTDCAPYIASALVS